MFEMVCISDNVFVIYIKSGVHNGYDVYATLLLYRS